jgi:tRNA(Ile)-lysidine synthase
MVSLEKILFNFLQEHADLKAPVLLALSGGPDSLALYTLLLKYRSLHPLHFGVAHVDHGWREESGHEALALEKMASQNKHPFHLKKLDRRSNRNLEEAARNERLNFFSQLCASHRYQAVLLAHHADDLAETVLKRILESAHLTHLGGLRACSKIRSLKLWRPFLQVDKKEIMEWLKQQGLQGFEDLTNFDSRFLRGKLRTSIIPQLSEDFGKDVSKSLQRLGREAEELRDYFEDILEKEIQRIEVGPRGLFLDLSQARPMHFLELQYLLRRFCEKGSFCLSRSQLKTAEEIICRKGSNKRIEGNGKRLILDRGRMFLMNLETEVLPEEAVLLKPGSVLRYGPWEVSVFEGRHSHAKGGWKAVWEGECSISLTSGSYALALPSLDPKICKWWSNEKVPAFLRRQTPVVLEKDQIKHEFLTGRQFLLKELEEAKITIALRYVSQESHP